MQPEGFFFVATYESSSQYDFIRHINMIVLNELMVTSDAAVNFLKTI